MAFAKHGGPRHAKSLLLVLLAVAALLLGGAGTASAHAALLSSDPAADAVVKAAPKLVKLSFSEAVILGDDAIRVLDPDGNRVDSGNAGHAGGDRATARVTLHSGLPDGTFTVAWKAVSADSHPIAGAFTFSIGKPSETSVQLPGEEAGGGTVGRLYDLARYTAYGGYALLVGASAFVLGCWTRGAGRRPVQRLLLGGWSALLVATMAMLALRGPYESGGALGDVADLSVVQDTLNTKPGTALAVRLLLLAGAGAFLALLVGQSRRGAPPPDVRMGLLAGGGVLAIGLASTWASSEHASVGIQVGVAVPVDVVHLVAMAVWLGGLATLLTGLFAPGGRPLPVSAVRRFSRVALAGVTVLAATGAYQSWRQVGSWGALTSTAYGRLLLAKIAGVALLVVVAWYSRRWTRRLAEAVGDLETGEDGDGHGHVGAGVNADAVPAEPGKEPSTVTGAREVTGPGPTPGGGRLAPGTGAGSRSPATSGPSRRGPGKRGGGKGVGGKGARGRGPGRKSGDPRAAQLARQRAAVAAARAKRERDASPHRVRLRWSVLAEVGLAIVVLTVTTLLTTTEPGRTAERVAGARPAAAAPSGPATVNVLYDTGGTNGRGKAEITVDPARSGKNEVHAYLTDGAGQPVDVPALKIALTLAKRDIGPLDVPLKHLDVGHWTSQDVQLPMSGTWKVSVTVRTSEIDQVTESANLKVE